MLGATDDERVILRRVADCLRDLLEAERATVFRFHPDTMELVAVVAHGTDGTLDEDPAPIKAVTAGGFVPVIAPIASSTHADEICRSAELS